MSCNKKFKNWMEINEYGHLNQPKFEPEVFAKRLAEHASRGGFMTTQTMSAICEVTPSSFRNYLKKYAGFADIVDAVKSIAALATDDKHIAAIDDKNVQAAIINRRASAILGLSETVKQEVEIAKKTTLEDIELELADITNALKECDD